MQGIDHLRDLPAETEWLEFKRNRHMPNQLGQYLSALANGACVAGKPTGYLIFGVDDETHQVVGTGFDPYRTKAKGNQDLYYEDLVLALVREHGPVGRNEIDQALMSKLPDRLTDAQKRLRVSNLLQELRRSGQIVNQGTRSRPKWCRPDSRQEARHN